MEKNVLKNHLWGYADTEFTILNEKEVTLTGTRYPLSGSNMPYLLDYICERFRIDRSIFSAPIPNHVDVKKKRVEDLNPCPNLYQELCVILGETHVSYSYEDRLIHSHGQLSVSEIYSLIYQSTDVNLVDFVVYPQNEEQIIQLVSKASELGYALIPYGGGTNVSGALSVPDTAPRKVLSVDLSLMNKIHFIDKENKIAYVQAGIKGTELEALLNKEGFTFGHEPDSIEFSTLGGWIATNSSGMKRAKYGNIEDLVLEMDVITPRGRLHTKQIVPRHASGVSLKSIFFGSEGNLGIITAAYIKINTLPENRLFGALIFKDFETGVSFLKELKDLHFMPSSIRLVSNAEFRLGQALKKKKNRFKKLIDKINLLVLRQLYRFDLNKVVAAIYLFEGSKAHNKKLQKQFNVLSKKYQALSANPENGKIGYELTFSIAYIRDFFQKYHIIGETFETSATWSNCLKICSAVDKAMDDLCKQYGISHPPYLSYRVTQSYTHGVCIYFTLAFYMKGVKNPVSCYQQIEKRLREIIIQQGGSISHHHGVGKIRKNFLHTMYDDVTIESINDIKRGWDPDNIFCVQNGSIKGDYTPRS